MHQSDNPIGWAKLAIVNKAKMKDKEGLCLICPRSIYFKRQREKAGRVMFTRPYPFGVVPREQGATRMFGQ